MLLYFLIQKHTFFIINQLHLSSKSKSEFVQSKWVMHALWALPSHQKRYKISAIDVLFFLKRNDKDNQTEIQLLDLMFQDIMKRSSKPGIIREHFDIFFHLNGLWGDEMYRTFDINKTGYITFDEFLTSIDVMLKGSFEEKAKILFNFYDVDQTNGISYQELIKMLFSYPKQELNKMVTEERFLESIEDYQKNFYFYPQKLLLKDCNIVEEDSQTSSEVGSVKRICSFYNASAQFYADMKNYQQQELNDLKQNRKNDLQKLKNGQNILKKRQSSDEKNKKLINLRNGQRQFKSILTQKSINEQKRKKYVVCSNISSLVKKYAAFLFKEFKLDFKKQEMTLEQFSNLVKTHQSIFDPYFEGFHSYIWNTTPDGQPKFREYSCFKEGECAFENGKNGHLSKRYLYYTKHTIFVLLSEKSKRPELIINMQGLSLEQTEQQGLYGFVIKHRDGIYPQKKCLFQSREIQIDWLSYLSEYKNQSVYDVYTLLEKVGQGNFSSVYRGVQKQKNEEVAIKVIKKFELSQNEKNVLKSECGILELCHHPNIVKFHNIFNTRSHMYIVSEYLGEGDLFEYVKKHTFLEEYEAALIVRQLADVIKYLGMLDLIHRDLKPENIMLILNKEKSLISKVKLIDFGFAVYKHNLKNLSKVEKYAGTPGYIAPQVFYGEEFDESYDVFSLGVIMYFMLCGSLPFFSSFYEEIVEQTKDCNIVLKNAHWNNVSEEAKDLIEKMITFKDKRITIKQVVEHPWLKDIDDLKKYDRVNKKRRYI